MKLGCINFGGPAGQIAIMHRELVDLAYRALGRLKWPVYVLVPVGALAGVAWTLLRG